MNHKTKKTHPCGEFLERFMEQRSMTKQDMATALGIHPSYLSNAIVGMESSMNAYNRFIFTFGDELTDADKAFINKELLKSKKTFTINVAKWDYESKKELQDYIQKLIDKENSYSNKEAPAHSAMYWYRTKSGSVICTRWKGDATDSHNLKTNNVYMSYESCFKAGK